MVLKTSSSLVSATAGWAGAVASPSTMRGLRSSMPVTWIWPDSSGRGETEATERAAATETAPSPVL